jgi:hypothetical protein
MFAAGFKTQIGCFAVHYVVTHGLPEFLAIFQQPV